jgi:hypothetical protein
MRDNQQAYQQQQVRISGGRVTARWTILLILLCSILARAQVDVSHPQVDATTATASASPNFGPNVRIFAPAMSMADIQKQLADVYARQQSEFGVNRCALFFKPGVYTNLDVNLTFYMQVIGLGQMPDDVVIHGNVHSEGEPDNNDNATCNFWRSCENLAVAPTNNSPMTWAVSQDTSLRRIHVRGGLNLSNTGYRAYSSGGFMADSTVDGTVDSLTQQQWLSRNDAWGEWAGQNWNIVFTGVTRPPPGVWPAPPYTVITNTPLMCEKPFLSLDAHSQFIVVVPNLATNTIGTSWSSGPTPGIALPISQFYLAQPDIDAAANINAALRAGFNLILTPGVYHLADSILITRPDTIVMGLGFPTLVPTTGHPALVVANVPGVKIANIIFDAGMIATPTLLEVGTATNSLDYSADPVCLYDICSRVGGATPGATTNCVTINANNVIGDNLWLWRADHGAGVGWRRNVSLNGLVVNGNDVTMYGLFVEHHEQYQTLWNGNGGRTYFYQSELPYDAPSQSAWSHDGVNGYASYKVADSVSSHQAFGLGVYGVFLKSTAKCFNAFEAPANSPQVDLHNLINVYITGRSGSEMTHVINGTGAILNTGVTTTTVRYLRKDSAIDFRTDDDSGGPNTPLGLAPGPWSTTRLQDENSPPDSIGSIMVTVFGAVNP